MRVRLRVRVRVSRAHARSRRERAASGAARSRVRPARPLHSPARSLRDRAWLAEEGVAEALHLREVVVVAQRPQLPPARWPQLAAWEHNRRLWSPSQRLSFDSANNESIANRDLLTNPAVGVRSHRCVAPQSSCSTSSERGVKKDQFCILFLLNLYFVVQRSTSRRGRAPGWAAFI